MKKFIYTLALIPFLLTSCVVEPDAFFFTDKVNVEVGEEILFTNNSINAFRFEWRFGDGKMSTAPNPIYSYSSTGSFQVELAAISKNGHVDYAYQTINVVSPTILEIEVLEWFDEYPVAGASVILYPTLNDWNNETNGLPEGFTNNSGKVIFTGLGPWIYYVDVWEQNHNNYTLAEEDVNFIRTDEIIPNQVNQFIAWVDYVGTKGTSTGDRDRKMKIVKLERKVTDK